MSQAFELIGKYSSAKVFTFNCDNETNTQIMGLLNQFFIKGSKVRIMPDTHAGSNCVVGTTITINDKVVPNLVGGDIGCGMRAVKISNKDVDFDKLDAVIRESVPCGFRIREKSIVPFKIDELLADVDKDYSLCSIGTLGGGNHFIEMDKDKEGNLWLVVHTGSRHLGKEVCKYHQNIAIEYSKGLNEYVPKELSYVQGESFKNYIHDMKITQEFASLNRETIVKIIVDKMGFEIVDFFDTIHNYIDLDNMILRKGAISAQLGEKVIIPMNMRDGSLICIGKGNEDWNFSAPHGAGRIMSRSQAKELVSIEEYEESMKGIYTTSVKNTTLDESPMVYKPMEELVENVKDTVDIIDIIKPLYNFKAS